MGPEEGPSLGAGELLGETDGTSEGMPLVDGSSEVKAVGTSDGI